MSERRGCLKSGCFGVLGIFALLLVVLGINLIVAVSRNGNEEYREDVLSSETATSEYPLVTEWYVPADDNKPPAGQGIVVLELNQGDFSLHRGQPGEGVVVKASYDANIYELTEFGQTWPDSSWVYQVRFRRTISGLQAMLSSILGGGAETEVHIYLPPDLQFELNLLVNQGGLEADIGGLWLTDVDVRMRQGGLEFDVSEPLREPIGLFSLHGRMGGCAIRNLGNASPRVIDLGFSMGGVAVDLSGHWRNDCDAKFTLRMGGMEVVVPENLAFDRSASAEESLRRDDQEVPTPTLRVTKKVSMGEIEFR